MRGFFGLLFGIHTPFLTVARKTPLEISRIVDLMAGVGKNLVLSDHFL